ncbi:ATP synthase F1 subunit delta [Candidatus Fermentibacteria bacterium]|nr:ATP synthase F1 subunit delta [Candidatus Fermentibacteria bacterium]
MDNLSLAGGYAGALLSLARSRRATEAVEAELRVVGQLLKRDQGVRRSLRDPEFPEDARIQGLRHALGDLVSDVVTGHLIMMIQQGHGHLIGSMIDLYLNEASATKESITAEVHAAIPLDENQISRLERALSKRFSRPVRVQGMVDPSAEGGLLIKAGNELIDASVRTRLNHLRTAMRRHLGALATPDA